MIAADSAGLGRVSVILYHLVPYLKSHILSYAALIGIEVFTLEAGLSYLGLSIPPPFPTWGGMITQGLPYFESGTWLVIIPTLFLFMTILSFYQISVYSKSIKS